MPLLWVGKDCPGKFPHSNTAINSGDKPLQLTLAMQEVKMKFIEATMRLLVVDETKQEDVLAVKHWIVMATRTVNTSVTEQKCDDDGGAEYQEP